MGDSEWDLGRRREAEVLRLRPPCLPFATVGVVVAWLPHVRTQAPGHHLLFSLEPVHSFVNSLPSNAPQFHCLESAAFRPARMLGLHQLGQSNEFRTQTSSLDQHSGLCDLTVAGSVSGKV